MKNLLLTAIALLLLAPGCGCGKAAVSTEKIKEVCIAKIKAATELCTAKDDCETLKKLLEEDCDW